MEQEEYDLIFSFIRGNKFPDTLGNNKKDALRRKSKNFIVKNDGMLYFKDKKKNKDLKVKKC